MTRRSRITGSRLHLGALLVSAAVLTACDGEVPPAEEASPDTPPAPAEDAMSTDQSDGLVEGSVLYLERIAPPPGAVLTVSLQDVSRADAPATVLGEETIEVQGGPPWAFSLAYDRSAIDDRGRYGIRATLRGADGGLMFTTDEFIPAFDEAREGPLEIRMRRTGTPDAVNTPNAALVGTRWKLETLEGDPVQVFDNRPEPHLRLDAEDTRVTGFAGCNEFTGSWGVDEEPATRGALTFTEMAATQRACMEGMEQESVFLRVLGEVRTYRIRADMLALIDESGRTRATFSATYLR